MTGLAQTFLVSLTLLALALPAVRRRWSTLAELAALASGQDDRFSMVVGDGGRAAQDLLGVEAGPGTVRVPGWAAAKEYVATHEGAWALVASAAATLAEAGVGAAQPLIRMVTMSEEE